ncbi:hypothetical protein [Arthrobacter sp. PAMC25284]|uniref:hypothetical protein n=1 Tax=Arthrobacter sp. PAMC25284 TaxID=2861279 RepID=UPI001C63ABB8|nr:hypothetical protein [Arthrobacter sp. PAMC25284]QYF89710.1 hypothetical protein KY499_17065 [Arthrobacter sp. PAMC25284]
MHPCNCQTKILLQEALEGFAHKCPDAPDTSTETMPGEPPALNSNALIDTLTAAVARHEH